MNLIRKSLILSAGILFAFLSATATQPNGPAAVTEQSLNGNDRGNGKGRICLVDDDFKQGKVFDYKHLLDSLGIRCSFSIFPNEGDPEYYKQWQKDSIKAWQDEGYSFLLHPRHSCWRSDRYKSADECEESLLNSIEAMRTTAATDWEDYIVYPGASGKNPEVVQMVGKYVRYGVGQSGSLTVEGAPIPLPRIFIKPTSDPAKIKERIRAKLEKGELVILGTHSYEFNKASFPLLIDIIEYAKTLAEFMTLQKALAAK